MRNMKSEKQIRKFIAEIPYEVRNMSYDELVKACDEYFSNIPIIIIDFDDDLYFFGQREYGEKILIYRARKIENDLHTPHPFISDIDAIPMEKKHLVNSFGRSNKKGEPMFYGAMSNSTACFETISKGIDFQQTGSTFCTVGCWIIENPFKMARLPFSIKYIDELTCLSSIRTLNFISNKRLHEEEEKFRNLCSSELEYDILKLFADAFANFNIECENDYYLSNYYKDRIFNTKNRYNIPDKIDAIIYPSVPSSFQMPNIVIKPDIVKKNMRFLQAMQVWVQLDVNGRSFNPIQQKITADINGKLNWK